MSSAPSAPRLPPGEVDAILRARIRGVVAELDARGAGLAAEHGGDAAGLIDVRAAHLDLGAPGTVSAGGRARLIRCADGWVAVSLPRREDIDMVPAWLETDTAGAAVHGGGAEPPWDTVQSRCAERRVSWVLERAILCGLAVFEVGEFGGASAVRAEHLGHAESMPCDGASRPRVVNLAGLWAGPLAADVCARLGAGVVTVESIARPDGARATPGFHRLLHRRDTIVGLDLRTDDDRTRLAGMLAEADVVIEGSRPRALEQMGIDARALITRGPRVWVSITGAGRSGPNGVRIGFGDDAAAGGGVVGWNGDVPSFVADAVADPLTGVTAAAEIAARLESGGRWLLDIALARVAGSLWT